jgi:hypothetical protein
MVDDFCELIFPLRKSHRDEIRAGFIFIPSTIYNWIVYVPTTTVCPYLLHFFKLGEEYYKVHVSCFENLFLVFGYFQTVQTWTTCHTLLIVKHF